MPKYLGILEALDGDAVKGLGRILITGDGHFDETRLLLARWEFKQ